MSMLNIHAEALDGSSGPYHEFLLSYKVREQIVFGFVEGKEDPAYYRGLIESMLPEGWTVRLIRSGNRDAVLRVRNQMDWSRFPSTRICFFVDRDLSAFLESKQTDLGNLYVTDNYSIENDIVTAYVFGRVVEEILNITGLQGREMDSICALFAANLCAFQEAMLPIMAQILVWRRMKLRPVLDNLKLDALFNFEDGKVYLKPEYESVAPRVGHAAMCMKLPPVSEADLNAANKELRSKDGARKFIRGKYLLWFMVKAALSLHSAIPAYCVKHPRPPKMRVTLGIANAMLLFAPRSRMPLSLRNFISLNYLKYIGSSFAEC